MSYINITAPFNKKKVGSPEELWSHFMDYAKISDESPLVEPKIFSTKTGITHGDLDKVRPYTLNGFCNYLGISPATFSAWKAKEKEQILVAAEAAAQDGREPELSSLFNDVMAQIESIIYDQQYQGAVVNVFNASVVQRKLGLVDKRDIALEQTIFAPDIEDGATAQEAAELYEQTLNPDES